MSQRLQVLAQESLEVRQMGILDALNEDLGEALQSQHQTGPDLGFAVLVLLHVAHTQGRDPAGGGVPDALGVAHRGVDDAEFHPRGRGLANGLQQANHLGLDVLEARRHTVAG